MQELINFVSIPSVYAQNEHFCGRFDVGNWVVNSLIGDGISNASILPTKTHPVVYAYWLLAGSDKLTIFIYGYFYLQPVNPLDSWDTSPFEPVICNNRLFGCGASDDKENMLAPIVAIEAFLKANGALPVNVKFFYEGQEEIGSPTLPEFIKANGAQLAADIIFSSDGGQWGLDQLSLILGLKGLVGCEIQVMCEERDLHLGMPGGGIANPIHLLSLII